MVVSLAIRIVRFEIAANRWRFELLRTTNRDSRNLRSQMTSDSRQCEFNHQRQLSQCTDTLYINWHCNSNGDCVHRGSNHKSRNSDLRFEPHRTAIWGIFLRFGLGCVQHLCLYTCGPFINITTFQSSRNHSKESDDVSFWKKHILFRKKMWEIIQNISNDRKNKI